jgi:1-acyl-sn-glycerol-3-phosphate acyltransferase
VVVANHASYVDAFALLAVLPGPFSFLAKAELASRPGLGFLLGRLGTRFVERFDREQGIADARRATELAAGGARLLVFPEGTFDRAPGLLPFRMGAFLAAAQAAVPVVPVALRGTRNLLRSGSWFPRPGGVLITVQPPIAPAQGEAWPVALGLREAARAAILAHCAEPDLAGEPGPTAGSG